MARTVFATAVLSGVLLLGSEAPASAQIFPPSAIILLRFDTNADGTITRDEVDAGLQADFAAADTDGNSCINDDEIRVENDRRLAREGAQATPLVDWNLDQCVDMVEFGSTIRTYFDFADITQDGSLSRAELGGPSMPLPLPGRNTARPEEVRRPLPTTNSAVFPGIY